MDRILLYYQIYFHIAGFWLCDMSVRPHYLVKTLYSQGSEIHYVVHKPCDLFISILSNEPRLLCLW